MFVKDGAEVATEELRVLSSCVLSPVSRNSVFGGLRAKRLAETTVKLSSSRDSNAAFLFHPALFGLRPASPHVNAR